MKKILIIILIIVSTWIPHTLLAATTYSVDLEWDDNDGFYINDNAPLSITGDLTIELWAKFETINTTNYCNAVCKWAYTAGQRSYCFTSYTIGANDYWMIMIDSDGSSATTQNFDITALDLNVWYHFAVVYDSSAGTSTLYYLDEDDAAHTSLGTVSGLDTGIFNSSASFGFNRMNNSNTESDCDLKMDDVRLWNKAFAVADLDDRVEPDSLAGTESGLVGLWELENNANDSTANANNLTAINTPVYDNADFPVWTGGSAPAAETPPSWWEAFVI